MHKNSSRALCALGVISSIVALTPTQALADGERSGIELLIPTMAEFVPALVAFVVIFIVVAKLVWPKVVEMMDKREAKIQADLDEAERAKAKAVQDAKDREQELVEAHRQAEAIIAQAKKEAEEERAEVLAKAQHEASEIIAKSYGVIDAERHKAMIELSGSVVDLSVEIAGKIIGNDLSDDDQRKLAEKYLAEVGTPDGN